MNIEIYCSENGYMSLGNGKTLQMIMDSYKFRSDNPDYKILSNFKLSFADEYFNVTQLVEILKKHWNVLVLCDELNVILHAYNYLSKESKESIPFFRQLRKRNVYVKCTTQNRADVPKHIRDLGNLLYAMRKIHKDRSLCFVSDNEKCIYDEHYYQKLLMPPQENNPNLIELSISSPHLITLEGEDLKVTPNFFYESYDSKELILPGET